MQSANLNIAARWKQWMIPLGLCLLLWGGGLVLGGESEDTGGVLRSRVYNLRHISSEQARDLFSQLNIGKSYNTLTPDMLIITSNIGSDLVMATEIIDVLDQTPPVQVRTLMVASDSQPLPPLDEFFAILGSISAGTLTEAPAKGAQKPVIIDVLGDELIAIAAEDELEEIEIAVEDWKKKHPASTSESQEAPGSASGQVFEKPLEESSSQVEPKAVESGEEVAEPNVPEFDPEPNDLPEPALEIPTSVEPVVIEEPAPALDTEWQQPSQKPLEEVAQQVFEDPSMTDADEPSAEIVTEQAEVPPAAELEESADGEVLEEVEEDFLSEGLLQELADAQQEAKVELMPDEATVAEASEEQDDPMKTMRALLAQARAQDEEAGVAEETVQEAVQELQAQEEPELVSPPELESVPTSEPVEETDTLQAELAVLRQRLAELEAKAVEDEEPDPEMIAEETKRVPQDADPSKIQAAQTVQTEPQLNPQLSEKELDTVIDLPQEVELESLIDLVGKQLGLNYFYDPAILKGQKVTLKLHGGKIKVRETYTLLESVLRQKGFVMTRRGELVTIIKTEDANQAEKLGDIVIREPGDPIPPGTLIVKTKFTLKDISTATAKNTLTQLQLGLTNGFQEFPETNMLIVTDYAYRMDQIQKVLDMIDVPGEAKEYEFRTLKFMKPSEMVPKLQELAGQLQDVSLQISTPTAAAPRTRSVTTRDPKTGRTTTKQVPITTSTPAAAQTPEPDAVYIDTDDRTNRILMAGKAEQIELINELIDALDVPQYDLKVVREYIIENVEAGDVIDVLNELALATVTVSTPTRDSKTTPKTPATSRTTRTPTPPKPTTSQSTADGDQPFISVRPATNSLLVNATVEQHKAIELVIAHVDVVQKDQRTIRQYEIQYVDTQEIMDTLTDLDIIAPQDSSARSSSRDASSRSSRQTTSRSPQQPQAGAEGAAPVSLPTVAGGSEKELTAERPQISVLETTNSLLVYATPRQHDAIALVIGHADRQLDTTTTPYVVYNLENQNSLDLAITLNDLIETTFEEVEAKSSPDSKIQTSGAPTSNIPTLQDKRPKVIGDEKSNSIIVYGNKRNQQWVSKLVEELDQNRFQVLLDVTLVEISKTDEFTYDLDLVSAIPNIDPLSGALSDIATDEGGLFHSMGNSTVEGILDKLNTADQSSFTEGIVRSGKFDGFYGNEHIMVLLDLMQSKGYGRVLNRPRILVNDNEPGVITLEQVTYRQIRTNVVQGTDNPITTENIDYQDYSAGITLEITPHISQEDRLRLEIKLNRSDFVETLSEDENRPPDTINSDVDTIVTVPDENTVILGGLERVNQSKGGNKVPILGDIPIIGGLFRSIDNSSDQRKIYIFVKANILRPGEDNQDLKDISDENIKVFEYYEREMQDYQDWPGIDPEPIEPKRILREEDDILEGLGAKLEGDFVVQDHWPTG